MPAPTNSIEGHFQNEHHASFFVVQVATATWTEVKFTDFTGEEFVAHEFHLETVDANAVDISFDPRVNVETSVRVVHGIVQGTSSLDLPRKSANRIFIKRNAGVDGTLRIFAWR